MLELALSVWLASVGASSAEVGQWTIRSDRPDDPVVARVAELLPRAQRELEAKLGLAIGGHGVVELWGSTQSFRRATPGVDHRHTLGVAYPAQRLIHLNRQAIESRPYESFAITLRHELCHVIVGEVVRRGHRRPPLWFDEGVAVWCAGKVPLYDPRAFELAARAGTLRPLAELAERFPADPTQRGIAYEQSESFVRFVVERHGAEGVRTILRLAADGAAFAEAFREATGRDVTTLEREWLASLRPRWPWLSWLVRLVFHPYSAFGLFGVMTLLALVSFTVYWRRRRRRYQEWEREERVEGNPWD